MASPLPQPAHSPRRKAMLARQRTTALGVQRTLATVFVMRVLTVTVLLGIASSSTDTAERDLQNQHTHRRLWFPPSMPPAESNCSCSMRCAYSAVARGRPLSEVYSTCRSWKRQCAPTVGHLATPSSDMSAYRLFSDVVDALDGYEGPYVARRPEHYERAADSLPPR